MRGLEVYPPCGHSKQSQRIMVRTKKIRQLLLGTSFKVLRTEKGLYFQSHRPKLHAECFFKLFAIRHLSPCLLFETNCNTKRPRVKGLLLQNSFCEFFEGFIQLGIT